MMRKIVVLLTLASTAPLLAQAPTGPAAEAPFLPIAKVVLYKSGVGYFEHLGTVIGSPRVAVQFTGAQLDDVLKSLTTLDLGDGRVVGVSYESPTPIERRLQALRLPLDQSASILDLLTALRGARIEVVQASGVGVTGRLLGVERRSRTSSPPNPPTEIDELTVVTDRGEVASLPMNGVRVRVLDAGLRQEVGRYLDVAASARDLDARRMIISTAGTASRQLFVSYITEAAVWKTTYRLLFPTTGNREPILQGWAIVDNMGAQDWENVELSLIAGAPQSFVQPLSQPLFTRRPSIALPTGLLPTPQEHAGALTVTSGSAAIQGRVTDPQGLAMPGVTITLSGAAMQTLATSVTDAEGEYRIDRLPAGVVNVKAELQGFRTTVLNSLPLAAGQTSQRNIRMQVGAVQEVVAVTAESARIGGGTGGGSFRGGAGPAGAVQRDAVEQRLQDAGPAASGSELGELFEYRLTDRVTIRRNQSALVPILQARVAAERVSLWNESMGSRPRRAVWLTNSSALTLDAGSVSVADAGAFAGEGLLDTLKPNERRLVSYASDLSVVVSAKPGPSVGRTRRVVASKGIIRRDVEERADRTYTIRNQDRERRLVVIEHPVRSGWTVSGATPVESTAASHRFQAPVAPGETVTLSIDEARRTSSSFAVGKFDEAMVAVLSGRPEDRDAIERAFRPVVDARAEVARLDVAIGARRGELTTISADQTRLRENMKALGRSDGERRLLERYTSQLAAQEDRLDTLQRELDTLVGEQAVAAKRLDDVIGSLALDLTF
jgi:hypothetical protein